MIYQSGDTALLPCDVSVPKPRGSNDGGGGGGAKGEADELRLIMWYREDVKSPIYRDVESTDSTLATLTILAEVGCLSLSQHIQQTGCCCRTCIELIQLRCVY